MYLTVPFLFAWLSVAFCFSCWGEPPGVWQTLPSLKNSEGYAGSFAGKVDGTLFMIGGANFPEAKPWEGGKKKWSPRVYALEIDKSDWEIVSELPHGLAYGVSATHNGELICVGGSDADRHYAEVFAVRRSDRQVIYSPLPSLPKTLANASGAVVGTKLFVVGGQEEPSSLASSEMWSLDLADKNAIWKKEHPIPGVGRILATCSSDHQRLFVFGGVELYESEGSVRRRYLKDTFAYDEASGWKRLADLPQPLAACATPAPFWNNQILLVSGDDGSQVGKFAPEHKGFPSAIWAYDIAEDKWTHAGKTPAPRVTLPTVQDGAEVYFLSGEITPGIRSPEMWLWELDKPSER